MTKPAQERCGVCNWPIVDNGTRIEHVGFDHPADKPAATVHGTGSGEAKCPNPNCVGGRIRQTNGGCCICEQPFTPVSQAQLDAERVPTPPASPTVTLDRIDHAFESAISALAWLPQDGPIRKRTAEVVDELRAARHALALLRAAERQK